MDDPPLSAAMHWGPAIAAYHDAVRYNARFGILSWPGTGNQLPALGRHIPE